MPLEKEDLEKLDQMLSSKIDRLIEEKIDPLAHDIQRMQETKPDFVSEMNNWIDNLVDDDDDNVDDDNVDDDDLTAQDEKWDEETELMDDDDDEEEEYVDVEARRVNDKLQREIAALKSEQQKRDQAEQDRLERERIANRNTEAAKLFDGKVHKGSEMAFLKTLLDSGELQEKGGELGRIGRDTHGDLFTPLSELAESILEKEDYSGWVPPRPGSGTGNDVTNRSAPTTQHLTDAITAQQIYEMTKNDDGKFKEIATEAAAMV